MRFLLFFFLSQREGWGLCEMQRECHGDTRRRTCFLAVLLTDACVTGSKQHIELPRLVRRRRGKLANFLLVSCCIIGSEARFVPCSTGHRRLAAINLS